MSENLNVHNSHTDKELVIFDIDGTIIKGQSQRLFLAYLYKNHYVNFSYMLRVQTWFVLYKLGLVKNPKPVMEYAFSFAKEKSVEEIAQIAEHFFQTSLKLLVSTQAAASIQAHKKAGRKVILLSNAVEPIVKPLAKFLETDGYLCTQLEQANATYTGKISGNIMYGSQKLVAISDYANTHGYSYEPMYAYSDHHSDLPLLQKVGKPYAVNPTPALKKYARKHGWPIEYFHS